MASGSEIATPLPLDRLLLDKVWGGRALERTPGIALDRPGPIGESWEVVDRDGQGSTVTGGPQAGRTLRGLMLTEREDLLGRARPAEDGSFPLLVKYLDAQQALSVQVHPGAAVAARMGGGCQAKTEAWYVLAAEPGSWIYLGLKPGVDASAFAAAASGEGVVDLLASWKVAPGQCYFVPAGTVHAIGGGVTIVEVQENSDTTFRLYDWGRKGLDGKPRETHLEEGLLAIDFDATATGPVTPERARLGSGAREARLVDCDRFGMRLLEVSGSVSLDTEGLAQALLVLRGAGAITAGGETVELAPASTWLLPAVLGAYTVEARGGDLELLLVETRP